MDLEGVRCVDARNHELSRQHRCATTDAGGALALLGVGDDHLGLPRVHQDHLHEAAQAGHLVAHVQDRREGDLREEASEAEHGHHAEVLRRQRRDGLHRFLPTDTQSATLDGRRRDRGHDQRLRTRKPPIGGYMQEDLQLAYLQAT